MLTLNWRVFFVTWAIVAMGASPWGDLNYAQEPLEVEDGFGVVAIQATPTVCVEPCEVEVSIHIPSHEQNQSLIVMWLNDGGVVDVFQMYIVHDREDYVLYVSLPVDSYTFRVMVIREEDDGLVGYKAEQPVKVVTARRVVSA